MSHFVVLVLLKGQTWDRPGAEAATRAMLEPFSENLEVEEHDTPCHCVGDEAAADVRRQADEKFGTMNDLRARFREEQATDPKIAAAMDVAEVAYRKKRPGADDVGVRMIREDASSVFWRERHYLPRAKWTSAALKTHPGRDKADPMCGRYKGERKDWWPDNVEAGDNFGDESRCSGSGTYRTTANQQGEWDWWSIGGRWTGHFSPDGYDPERDIRNIETCVHCGGTGKRTDMVVANGCNGCRGRGVKVKWPTQWVDYDGDVLPVPMLAKDDEGRLLTPFAILDPEGRWSSREEGGWVPGESEEWNQKAWAILADYGDCTAVVVDCHT